jgi:RNA polymerase sigma-70 factor (ECF subfamily)
MSKRLRSDMPEEETESKEEQRHLLDSIRRLPEDRQQLLILKYVERLSNAEIGKIMDRTEGAVKSLYYRTLSALREQFDIDEAKMEETQDGS